MKSNRRRAMVRSFAVAAVFATAAVVVPGASAHEGAANCEAPLAERGSTYEGSCILPFQGFPVGVAGVYESDPEGLAEPGSKPAEIHVELLAKVAGSPPRAIGVECTETTTGVARCLKDYNPLGNPLTSPEPAPAEAIELICNAHTHAKYSRLAPPAGRFACWSTDEARADLEKDGFFADGGFGGSDPGPDPEPGALGPLTGSGLTTAVTTVPFNTYAPDTIVVSRSLGLTYVNVDTARHDVVALEAKRADGSAPWCANFENPENPASKDCPLFWSPLIPGSGSETPVLGLEDTVVGESYAFFCSIHPYMTGTIEVVE